MSPRTQSRRGNAAEAWADRLSRAQEISIWENLDHPNLVHLLDVFEDPQHIILITVLMEGGDLFHRLRQQPEGRYSEAAAARLGRQIVAAVAYLHSRGVVHCDLKPSNVLVAEPPEVDSSNGDVTVKVADFGLSQTLVQSSVTKPGAQALVHSGSAATAHDVLAADAPAANVPAVEPLGARLTAVVGTVNYFAPELVGLVQASTSHCAGRTLPTLPPTPPTPPRHPRLPNTPPLPSTLLARNGASLLPACRVHSGHVVERTRAMPLPARASYARAGPVASSCVRAQLRQHATDHTLPHALCCQMTPLSITVRTAAGHACAAAGALARPLPAAWWPVRPSVRGLMCTTLWELAIDG